MFYDTSLEIAYSNDEQYRDCLGKIFGISSNGELGHTTEILSKIYDATSKDPRFAQLYKRAASIIMSDDPANGLPILFSYSCLAKFHTLLSIFLSRTSNEGTNKSSFENLFNELNQIILDI